MYHLKTLKIGSLILGILFIFACLSWADTQATYENRKGEMAQIGLDRTNMTFYRILDQDPPPSQSFQISNTAGGILEWNVADDADWLMCSPATGRGDSSVNVYTASCELAPGTYNATISVSSPYASNSPQQIDVQLDVYPEGTDNPPFGYFDSPLDNSTVRSSIPVTGWVLDDVSVDNVKIYRNPSEGGQVYVGDAVLVEGARPDVAQSWPQYPNNTKAGWGYMMLTNFLPNGGNGTYVIEAIATDSGGNQTSLGTKTIYCDNANAVKPFGAIDTPSQGGTASGNGFMNWGWALTPQPKYIPTDGSTINVYVDGANLGHPAYNKYRQDIANLFPDYQNSNGAAGLFYFDTTGYADGVHSIYWTATDSEDRTDGIGSRYFTIDNGSDRQSKRESSEDPTRWANSLKRIPTARHDGIQFRKGFNDNSPMKTLPVDETGILKLRIKPMERVVIKLKEFSGLNSSYVGGMMFNNTLKSLPIGSTLDNEKGMFHWIPGPGFKGDFRLIFIEKCDGVLSKKIVQITIDNQ